MTAEKKIAHNRMTLLQLAERLRNVSEACRRRGISRSQFYEYKWAFQERGFDGLMDRPPVRMSFPNETPPEIKERIMKLSAIAGVTVGGIFIAVCSPEQFVGLR